MRHVRLSHAGLLGLAGVLALEGAAPRAEAARARRVPGPVAPSSASPRPSSARPSATELQRLGDDLLSTDGVRVHEAVARLVSSRAPEALERLHEALALGLSPSHAAVLLEGVGEFKEAKSFQLLELYSGSRNLKVRLAAVGALARLTTPALEEGVRTVLRQRLGDLEPEVRAAAAEALAERGDTAAAVRLFALLKKGDAGAAGPLGRLTSLDEAPRIAELRGVTPDGPLAVALGEILRRAEAPERLRLDLVRTLGGIPGPDATTALFEYVTAQSDGQAAAAPSVEEAQRLLERRGER